MDRNLGKGTYNSQTETGEATRGDQTTSLDNFYPSLSTLQNNLDELDAPSLGRGNNLINTEPKLRPISSLDNTKMATSTVIREKDLLKKFSDIKYNMLRQIQSNTSNEVDIEEFKKNFQEFSDEIKPELINKCKSENGKNQSNVAQQYKDKLKNYAEDKLNNSL